MTPMDETIDERSPKGNVIAFSLNIYLHYFINLLFLRTHVPCSPLICSKRGSLLTWNTFKLVCVLFYVLLFLCHLEGHIKEIIAFSLSESYQKKLLLFDLNFWKNSLESFISVFLHTQIVQLINLSNAYILTFILLWIFKCL